MVQKMFEKYIEYLNNGFEFACASKPLKDNNECTRIRIRPVMLKGNTMYQAARLVGTKEFHENLTSDEAAKLLESVTGNPFQNIEVSNAKGKLVVLVSKKGHMTVKEHPSNRSITSSSPEQSEPTNTGMDHNRKKNYLLTEGVPVPFLVELGVMTQSGKVIAPKYDKFRQINRYLEFVEDILPSLPKDRELNIVDFGCGKSYLTFALYYYLKELNNYIVRITGLDLKKDVIENCNALAKKLGYKGLEFFVGDIAGFNAEEGRKPDMVVTLHACDTATDYALEKAVKWGATVILCVPCCQHELNKQIKCEELKSITRYGLLKERFAAIATDALRAEMLEEAGYRTQVLEFIDMEHTPKNILIRAVRQPLKIKRKTGYEKTVEFLNVKPTLQKLLFSEDN